MATNEAEAERTLRNLTVLGELKQNDKLMTIGDTFSIYPPTSMRGLFRKWAGEHRESNLQRIHETIHSACAYVSAVRTDISSSPTTPAEGMSRHLAREHMQRRCVRIIEALRKSRIGLEHMMHTYSDDTTSRVRASLLVQVIDDFLAIDSSVDSIRNPPHLPLLPS